MEHARPAPTTPRTAGAKRCDRLRFFAIPARAAEAQKSERKFREERYHRLLRAAHALPPVRLDNSTFPLRNTYPNGGRGLASQSVEGAVSAFGARVKSKLANAAAQGAPEDQLRAPLENLFGALAHLCGLPDGALALVGETTLANIKTRPDYAVTVQKALVGFIEVKAPGKGADPRKFNDRTTRSSGTSSSRCPICSTPTATPSASGGMANRRASSSLFEGDIETSGAKLAAPGPRLR